MLSTIDPKLTQSTIAMGTIIAVATLGAIMMPIVVGSVAQVSGIGGGLATISIALSILLVLLVIKVIISRRAQVTR